MSMPGGPLENAANFYLGILFRGFKKVATGGKSSPSQPRPRLFSFALGQISGRACTIRARRQPAVPCTKTENAGSLNPKALYLKWPVQYMYHTATENRAPQGSLESSIIYNIIGRWNSTIATYKPVTWIEDRPPRNFIHISITTPVVARLEKPLYLGHSRSPNGFFSHFWIQVAVSEVKRNRLGGSVI
jgi:hypothetical protein